MSEIEILKEQNKRVLEKLELIVSSNQDLEKQLAEKEKEIESYKQCLKYTLNTYSDEFVEKDKELKELRYKVSNANQEKTNFTIEQLEKVKENFKVNMKSNLYITHGPLEILCLMIDNQIKELKEQL